MAVTSSNGGSPPLGYHSWDGGSYVMAPYAVTTIDATESIDDTTEFLLSILIPSLG